ncbi:MAG: tRNA pseudouridine(13) synthase TruD [Nanoarchaeota archaeon]
MFKLKTNPDDFYVKEILDFDDHIVSVGPYSLFRLIKTNVDSNFALAKIARILNLKTKDIGYCGIKDKRAVTEQYITIPSRSRDKAKSIDLKDQGITLEYISEFSDRLNVGDLDGNFFKIVVRNLDDQEVAAMKKNISERKKFPNYYGEQRFSENNISVGRSLIKRKFSDAVDILKNDPSYSRDLNEHLDKNPNDYVGALSKLPKHMLIFFVHAYQSYLWNLCIEKLVNSDLKLEQEDFPIIGFYFRPSAIIDKISRPILNQEKITPRDFVIRELPFLSAEGGSRDIYLKPEEINYVVEDDEINKKKRKAILEFTLRKGSYATSFIEQLFKMH